MDLSPYLDSIHRDLLAAAAAGGPETTRTAEALGPALQASMRLSLLEALADASAEITTELTDTSVELRLHGRDAQFVVLETRQPPAEPPVAPAQAESGEAVRVTLRIAERLKEQAEQAATAEGISLNAWLVRAIAAALAGSGTPSAAARQRQSYGGNGPHRLVGWADA